MANNITSHEDLEVWQLGIVLVDEIYTLTDSFPDKEKYRLVDQMCRAAISVPSNIAEGSTRKSTKEFMRYTAMALGSLAELKTQIIIGERRKYISADAKLVLVNACNLLGKKLQSLYSSLEKRL